ncbi:hypothetical protein ACFSJU_08725 [Paradesertivirga mongoliensis]|uniref:Uncharacterized protein n=1 Tax=Paradesertivirga mongoliensis TaxID=2100740 RepID=A0ABW4ZKW3_9SPHI|nr:hypothetical protein [Pedobacter mongoliensis]
MKLNQIFNPTTLIVFISLALLGFSLFQTAITYNDYNGIGKSQGLDLFLMGSIAILGGGLLEWIIWLANPISLWSIILFFQKKDKAKLISKIALGIALSFVFWQNILTSGNGRQAIILHKNSGYWLWLLSIFILTVGIHRYLTPAPESTSKLIDKRHEIKPNGESI